MKKRLGNYMQEYAVGLFTILLFVFCMIFVPNFSSAKNLVNISTQISINGLIATGMTFVILTGGIDLSVGSVAAVSSIAAADIVLKMPNPTVFSCILTFLLVSLVMGTVCGLFTGVFVNELRVPPFIASLATNNICRGAAYLYTNAQPIHGMDSSFKVLGMTKIGGVLPVCVLVLISVIILAYFYLTRTCGGRYVFSVGSSEEVSKLCGVNVKKVKYICYIVCSVLACLAGCVYASKLQAGQPSACDGYELNAIAAVMPELWGGSADLGGSNKTDLKGAATFAPAECATKQWPNCNKYGRQLHFGVREFTMGTITNGILLGSHTRPFGGTFFMFSDYERPAVRLAALMEIPNLYVWSHDSVAVGEDGPTHQPVEHLASFRAIPQLEVIRPADAFETAEAYRYFFEKKNTLPGAMVLTRQGVPVLAETAAKAKDGVRKGAYVLVDTEGTPDVILMASGSEVQWAVDAAKTLAGEGVKAPVVSMPSMEWFEEQDAEYKEAVLPASVKARVSVEAGVAMPWYKYLGSYGKPVSIEQFGLQGDGAQNMIDLGITAEHVVEAAKASIAEVEAAK